MTLNIYEYIDFRDFLSDFYKDSKESNKAFSLRYFAKKAGFASAAFLPLIIEGKRNLTKEFIPKFATAIGMSKKEHQYFEVLVSFNQAKNAEAKKYYFELLRRIRKDKAGEPLKDEQFEYLSNWYYPVIRELIALPDFTETPEWIAKKLNYRVTLGQARDALERLQNLGLITRDENGSLKQVDINVMTDQEVHYTAVYSYHQQMLSIAKEILAATNGTGHEISGITMPVSKNQFNEIKRMIHDFERDILRYLLDHPETPENVTQLNVQLLNLTERVSGRKNG
jgi:uncharacterized protein (TIGR02147 family)